MREALGASVYASASRSGALLEGIPPTPSFASGVANLPLVTQAPPLLQRAQDDTCSTTPNEVLLKISTQVLIPDYTSFYTATPITQFTMSYSSFPDGSLVASPYISEVRHGDWTLLFSGMMLMLFITTSFVSTGYIRRVNVKHKGLFYALLISQLCGVVAFIILAATVLAEQINCRSALIAIGVFTEISSALLLSGILGVKAYKCLNDSKAVLSVVIVLQVASSSLLFSDLAELDASRKLSLTCTSINNSALFSLSTTLRVVLASFICLCFVYAVWKSEKFPAAQGRISIALSGSVPPPVTIDEKDGGSSAARPRGWWDYVPDACIKPTSAEGTRAPTWHIVDDQGFVGNMRYLVGAWIKNDRPVEQNAKRKESDTTLVAPPPRQHAKRPSVVRFQDDTDRLRFSVVSGAQSSTPSKARSLGPFMNRMKLFREAMRNELTYTALTTLFNVIAAVLGLVGVFARTSAIDPEVFIGTYWGILSLLVMQSFSRVVRRHEREALLQNPSTWDPLYHVEKATAGEVRQGLSESASVSSNPWRVRSMVDPISGLSVSNENVGPLDRQEGPSNIKPNAVENPFEDFEAVCTPPPEGGGVDELKHKGKSVQRDLNSSSAGLPVSNAPVPVSRQHKVDDVSSLQWTEYTSSDSASRYSVNSSQSLFYLEKER